MKIAKSFGGYSDATAKIYVTGEKPVYLITILSPEFEYENNQRTDRIAAYSAWFSSEGLPPFKVKFPEEISLPDYMSIVEFEGLEAIEIRGNVYFKANNLKQVK